MTPPKANPFVSAALRGLFDAAVKAHDERHRDLFTPDGYARRASTVASMFWNGHSGVVRNWDAGSRQSPAYAYYRAGQFVRQREIGPA